MNPNRGQKAPLHKLYDEGASHCFVLSRAPRPTGLLSPVRVYFFEVRDAVMANPISFNYISVAQNSASQAGWALGSCIMNWADSAEGLWYNLGYFDRHDAYGDDDGVASI